jgi:hypothetical protein
MKERVLELETAFADALRYARSHPEVREHANVQETLKQMVFFSDRHEMELMNELRKLSGQDQNVPDAWIIRRMEAERQILQSRIGR